MKPKIIIDREPVSSAEILQRKNFQKLAADAKLMQKAFYQSNWFISTLAVAGVAILSTVLYFNSTTTNETTHEETSTLTQNETSHQLKAYSEDSPCIHPPIKGAEKTYIAYTFDAEKGAEFNHPSGSKIFIPANSITDKEGNLLTGKVTLNYREFHDQTDILLSGIPMSYDSAGYSYQFESAGMLDMNAEQNGNQVFLKKGEQIKIEFASRVPGTHFNFYQLDTVQRNWVYLGKDEVKVVATENTKSKNEENKTLTLSNSELENMKNEPEIKKLNQELFELKREIVQLTTQQPYEPKALNKSKFNFNLNVDPKEFPEFSAFQDTRFEVGSENKGFNLEMYQTVWDDAQLAENKKGLNYKLTLTKGKDKKTFIVYPVYEGATLEEAQKIYREKMNSYQQGLDLKKEEEKKKAEELKKQEDRWKKEALQNKKNAQLELANEKQKVINQQNEINYNSNLAQYGMVQINGQVQNINNVSFPNNASVVTRVLQTDGFGTFNCDTPQQWPKGANVQATFSNVEDGKKLKGSMVYLVIANKNLYFPYSAETWFNFKYNPKEMNALIMPLANGQVAYLSAGRFKEVDSDKTYAEFKMTVSENLIRTESDFRAFLMQN